jgi:hypothetical protein
MPRSRTDRVRDYVLDAINITEECNEFQDIDVQQNDEVCYNLTIFLSISFLVIFTRIIAINSWKKNVFD